jgi:XTP/dITP diphosphohydrolase
MSTLLVATRSAHKLQEIGQIFGASGGPEVVSLEMLGIPAIAEEEAVEAYATFVDNALAKARYFADLSELPVLADDSGLCVDALDGAPGVHSKRFSGHQGSGANTDRANNQHLLNLLQDVAPERRTAHYICVLAYRAADGEERVFHGRCDGVILTGPRGTAGFGYDPLFLPEGHDLTFGQLPASEKNLISHRSRALREAAEYLRTAF